MHKKLKSFFANYFPTYHSTYYLTHFMSIEIEPIRQISGFNDELLCINNRMYIVNHGSSYRDKLLNLICLDEQIEQDYKIQLAKEEQEEREQFTEKNEFIKKPLKEPEYFNEEEYQDKYDKMDYNPWHNRTQTSKRYANKKHFNEKSIRSYPDKTAPKKIKPSDNIHLTGYTFKLNCLHDDAIRTQLEPNEFICHSLYSSRFCDCDACSTYFPTWDDLQYLDMYSDTDSWY